MVNFSSRQSSDTSQLRLASIDSLRGIAVLGVVSVHCVGDFPSGIAILDLLMKMGRYGVQLFFLASAVTMMMMWDVRRSTDIHPVRAFYSRRAARIMPMFWVAIAVYVPFNGFGPQYYAPEGIGALTIALTALAQHGWWPTTINSVVPGGWSIAVEVTFYILFPFLLAFFASGQRILVGMVLFAVFGQLAKLAYARAFLSHNLEFSGELLNVFFGFWFPRQVLFFFCGALVYRAWRHGLPTFNLRTSVLFAIGFIALYSALGRGDSLVAVVLSLVVFIVLRKSLASPWLSAIGRRSYSIYLCHFVVLAGIAQVSRTLLIPGLTRLVVTWLCLVGVSYVIAGYTTRFVENPGIALGKRLFRRAQMARADQVG